MVDSMINYGTLNKQNYENEEDDHRISKDLVQSKTDKLGCSKQQLHLR